MAEGHQGYRGTSLGGAPVALQLDTLIDLKVALSDKDAAVALEALRRDQQSELVR